MPNACSYLSAKKPILLCPFVFAFLDGNFDIFDPRHFHRLQSQINFFLGSVLVAPWRLESFLLWLWQGFLEIGKCRNQLFSLALRVPKRSGRWSVSQSRGHRLLLFSILTLVLEHTLELSASSIAVSSPWTNQRRLDRTFQFIMTLQFLCIPTDRDPSFEACVLFLRLGHHLLLTAGHY